MMMITYIILTLTQTVTVTFTELDIESSIRCSYDRVALYDGRDMKASRLDSFCGSRRPLPLTSSSSAVFVVFVSDMEVNAGRFALSWTFNQGQSAVGLISQRCEGYAYPHFSKIPKGCNISVCWQAVYFSHAFFTLLSNTWLFTKSIS